MLSWSTHGCWTDSDINCGCWTGSNTNCGCWSDSDTWMLNWFRHKLWMLNWFRHKLWMLNWFRHKLWMPNWFRHMDVAMIIIQTQNGAAELILTQTMDDKTDIQTQVVYYEILIQTQTVDDGLIPRYKLGMLNRFRHKLWMLNWFRCKLLMLNWFRCKLWILNKFSQTQTVDAGLVSFDWSTPLFPDLWWPSPGQKWSPRLPVLP